MDWKTMKTMRYIYEFAPEKKTVSIYSKREMHIYAVWVFTNKLKGRAKNKIGQILTEPNKLQVDEHQLHTCKVDAT